MGRGASWIGRLPCGVALALGRLPGFGGAPVSWLLGQDPRRLCQRLNLEGPQLWDEPDSTREVWVDSKGPWPVAVWVLAFYGGPVRLIFENDRRVDVIFPFYDKDRAEPLTARLSRDGNSDELGIQARAEGKGFRVSRMGS